MNQADFPRAIQVYLRRQTPAIHRTVKQIRTEVHLTMRTGEDMAPGAAAKVTIRTWPYACPQPAFVDLPDVDDAETDNNRDMARKLRRILTKVKEQLTAAGVQNIQWGPVNQQIKDEFGLDD